MAFRRYYLHVRGDDRKKVLREVYNSNPPISDIRGLLTSRIIDPILDNYPEMTVKDLMTLKHEDLLLLRGFGRKGLFILRQFLKEVEIAGEGLRQQLTEEEIDTSPTLEYDEDEAQEEIHISNIATKKCAWSGYVKKNGEKVPGCANKIPLTSNKQYCGHYCSLRMFCTYMAEEIAWAANHLYGFKDWEIPITIEEFATIILHKQSLDGKPTRSMEDICKEYNIDPYKAVLVINHPIVRAKFPKVFLTHDPLLDSANSIDNKMAQYMAQDKKRLVTNEQISAAFGIPLYKVEQRLGANNEPKNGRGVQKP